MNPQETFHNVATGEIIVRQLTDEETAALEPQEETPTE